MPHLIHNKRTLYYKALVLVNFDTAIAGFHLLTGAVSPYCYVIIRRTFEK